MLIQPQTNTQHKHRVLEEILELIAEARKATKTIFEPKKLS